MQTIVNYELKITLTLLDNCQCTKNLIDLMYIRSPYRTSNDIMQKLGKTALDLVDKMPSPYIKDLSGYVHWTFIKPPLERLSLYFTKNIVSKDTYSITNENFPRKKVGIFENFLQFILECHPDNLAEYLVKYPEGLQEVKYEEYEVGLQTLSNSLELDSSYYKDMKRCECVSLECSGDTLQKIQEYYGG